MGFGGKIASEAGHYQEFVCAICQQLVDLKQSVVTPCAHVFCEACLGHWQSRQPSCPVCKLDLSNQQSKILNLKKGNPLAWRILSRVKVECPVQCGWIGDYSELQPHLLSSSDHHHYRKQNNISVDNSDNESEIEISKVVDALQAQAQEKFEAQNFYDALSLYTKTIDTLIKAEPSSYRLANLYSDRANVHLVLGNFRSGFEDAISGLAINKLNGRCWISVLRCLVALGHAEIAGLLVDPLLLIVNANNNIASTELDAIIKEVENYSRFVHELKIMFDPEFEPSKLDIESRHGLVSLSEILANQSSNPLFTLFQAKAHIEFGTLSKGLAIGLNALKKETQGNQMQTISSSQAIQQLRKVVPDVDLPSPSSILVDINLMVVISEGYFYSMDFVEALKFVKHCLQLDPDFQPAKNLFKKIRLFQRRLESVDKLNSAKQFSESESTLNELLKEPIRHDSPLSAQILAERANVYLRLEKFSKSLVDAESAISIQEDCRRAWLTKVYVYLARQEFQRAISELEPIMNDNWGQSDSVLRGVYDKAKFLLRKSLRADYYQLLSTSDLKLSSLSSEPEIKSAYKKKALEVHPDRFQDPAKKVEAEKEFKLVGEAFEVLTDSVKKKLYDEGYDKQGIEEEVTKRNRGSQYHH